MPLYEMIAIAKVGEIKYTKLFMKQISQVIWKEGGILRDVNVLGDRILAKTIKSSDQKHNLVGRYLQLIFDGNNDVKKNTEIFVKNSNNVLKYSTFRMKDFYNESQSYNKISAHESPLITEAERNTEYLESIKIALQEKENSILSSKS